MLSRVIILSVFVLFSFNGFTQRIVLAKAAILIQNNELDEAKLILDSAAVHKETKGMVSTWYYRGFVYKKLYSTRERDNKKSPLRLEAINSFKHFFELDTMSDLHESALKSMKFLAGTMYNDAALSLNTKTYALALDLFSQYEETVRITDPHHDFRAIEIKFNLVLGQVYSQLYDQDKEKNKEFDKKIEEIYTQVLELDSNNASANYNLGIHYYNKAVFIIKTIDLEVDLIVLNNIQTEMLELFHQSLPYMERAYRINPKKLEVLQGLAGIYFSLDKMAKSQEIQEELEELKKLEKEQKKGSE